MSDILRDLSDTIKQIDDQIVQLRKDRQVLADRLTSYRSPFPVGSVIEWDATCKTCGTRRGVVAQVIPWMGDRVKLVVKSLDKAGNLSEGTLYVMPYMNPRLAPAPAPDNQGELFDAKVQAHSQADASTNPGVSGSPELPAGPGGEAGLEVGSGSAVPAEQQVGGSIDRC